MVSIPFKPTMSALERLAVPVRFTLFRVDVQAFMARLGRVGWRNQDHLYASNRSFVFDKLPQLVERPVVGSAPFGFATLSSDAGILLTHQAKATVQVCQRVAACIEEWRAPHKITHSLYP